MQRPHKLRLVLTSVGSVLLLWTVVFTGLNAVSRWGEIHQDSYPWKEEDYLRYLLPSLHEERGADRMLLVGPSEAREGFIYQRFQEAFPTMSVFQGGQASGTFDDMLLALEYIDRVYGPDARPEALVVGITPRFVSNIISWDEPPLYGAINRYSPYYAVEHTPEGSRLVAKPWWEGLAGRVRFLSKQRQRYLTAMFTVLNRIMGDTLPYPVYEEAYFTKIRRSGTPGPMVLRSIRVFKLRPSLGRWSAIYISPYKYHHGAPRSLQSITGWIQHPESFWYAVHAWEPAEDAALIHRQFERLKTLAEQWNTRLYVVNLPEHPVNRAGYRPGRYEQYLELVQASLGDTPFLNLRDLFQEEGFYDAGHLTLPASVQMTDRVSAFIQTH